MSFEKSEKQLKELKSQRQAFFEAVNAHLDHDRVTLPAPAENSSQIPVTTHYPSGSWKNYWEKASQEVTESINYVKREFAKITHTLDEPLFHTQQAAKNYFQQCLTGNSTIQTDLLDEKIQQLLSECAAVLKHLDQQIEEASNALKMLKNAENAVHLQHNAIVVPLETNRSFFSYTEFSENLFQKIVDSAGILLSISKNLTFVHQDSSFTLNLPIEGILHQAAEKIAAKRIILSYNSNKKDARNGQRYHLFIGEKKVDIDEFINSYPKEPQNYLSNYNFSKIQTSSSIVNLRKQLKLLKQSTEDFFFLKEKSEANEFIELQQSFQETLLNSQNILKESFAFSHNDISSLPAQKNESDDEDSDDILKEIDDNFSYSYNENQSDIDSHYYPDQDISPNSTKNNENVVDKIIDSSAEALKDNWLLELQEKLTEINNLIISEINKKSNTFQNCLNGERKKSISNLNTDVATLENLSETLADIDTHIAKEALDKQALMDYCEAFEKKIDSLEQIQTAQNADVENVYQFLLATKAHKAILDANDFYAQPTAYSEPSLVETYIAQKKVQIEEGFVNQKIGVFSTQADLLTHLKEKNKEIDNFLLIPKNGENALVNSKTISFGKLLPHNLFRKPFFSFENPLIQKYAPPLSFGFVASLGIFGVGAIIILSLSLAPWLFAPIAAVAILMGAIAYYGFIYTNSEENLRPSLKDQCEIGGNLEVIESRQPLNTTTNTKQEITGLTDSESEDNEPTWWNDTVDELTTTAKETAALWDDTVDELATTAKENAALMYQKMFTPLRKSIPASPVQTFDSAVPHKN